jgi:DNA-binding Lrp family transcriptional regulator
MMTIMMIDVEAGKEDLFERLHDKYFELKDWPLFKQVKLLYIDRCYTHSDINMMFDVTDFTAIPRVFTEFLMGMDGLWDMQIIQLFSPKFFKLPKYVDLEKWGRFTVTIDVKSDKTETAFKLLRDLAASDEAAISFLAYTFYSYDNDIILTLLAPDIKSAGKFVDEKIRTIDGVIDTVMWEIEKSKFAIDHKDWVKYINHYREGDLDEDEVYDDAFICGC